MPLINDKTKNLKSPYKGSSRKGRRLKVAVFALKSVFAFSILWFLSHQGSLTLPSLEEGLANPLPLIFALLLIVLSILVGAVRWWLLLQSQEAKIPYLHILRINWIGAFANNFLPTGIGGDALRLFYICGEAPSKKAVVVTTVFVDRLVGLLALTVLVLASIAITLNVMTDNMVIVTLASQIGFALVLFLALTAIAIFLTVKTTWVQATFRLILWGKLQSLIISFLTAIRAYHNKSSVVVFGVFLSLTIHLMAILAIITIGQTLLPDKLPVWGYFFATPLSMIANQLPLTPGGVGIAELSFDQICRVILPQSGIGFAVIFLTYRVLFIVSSLAGGVMWLFLKNSKS